jgi:hypothetical protein
MPEDSPAPENWHGSCSVCGHKFAVGEEKIVVGVENGTVGLMRGVLGMSSSSIKFYCKDCARAALKD